MSELKYHFASDNTAGVCPEAWAALEEANTDFLPSYGDDAVTKKACDAFRDFFETDCDVYFVFNGTAANSLALASLCQSYHSIICHERAHVETDECGAPEFFSNGSKLLIARGANGKLDLDQVRHLITHRHDMHYPKPMGLTLSQSTELGTVYQPTEIQAACALAKEFGLHTHMDGARFANALAALDCKAADITWRAGLDVLCFGGTKLGMAVTEAVVFFDRELGREFAYRCKQAGQLCSKMRFISAQWLRILTDGVWRKHAAHANRMAAMLAAGLGAIPNVKVLYSVDANAVFCMLPPEVENRLQKAGWKHYNFIAGGGSRFMCSWKVSEGDVKALIADAKGS
ncbi:MAG: low specificity L-threonine aldolase [Verrucomicrobiaceae bacterium]|nr:low specificity L-threonine aldolase [Verrucomicrobiaceae bacterium]